MNESMQQRPGSDGDGSLISDGRPITLKRVSFRDCDVFGILYNTRYMDLVLDTRLDHLMDVYGIDVLTSFRANGPMPVIVGHQTSYFEPCRIHEQVAVSTTTIFVDAHGLVLEGAITSADGKRLKYHQWTRFKTLDMATGSAGVIPEEEIAGYRRTMCRDRIDLGDYEGRVKAIRASMRR